MIDYTQRLSHLARDIVSRVEPLSFIDPSSFLVFARFGRSRAEGPYATCHSLRLASADPGYFFWRDQATGEITRRSEWFVPRTPEVVLGSRRLDYLVSFALPRFCDQSLRHSRKRRFHPGADAWVAKLDTVVHELYHFDPACTGIRLTAGDSERGSGSCHGQEFFVKVAEMVGTYLASNPDPETYEFLKYDFAGLHARYGGVAGTTFRNFPSYPQVYLDRLNPQLAIPAETAIVPLRAPSQPRVYTEADLELRAFHASGARRITRRREAA
jgi:hypothetical protein